MDTATSSAAAMTSVFLPFIFSPPYAWILWLSLALPGQETALPLPDVELLR
jgi:hypothetical protein